MGPTCLRAVVLVSALGVFAGSAQAAFLTAVLTGGGASTGSATFEILYNPDGEPNLGSLDAQLTAVGPGILDVSATDGIDALFAISTFADFGGVINFGGFNFGFDTENLIAPVTIGTVTIAFTPLVPDESIHLITVPGSILFQNLAGPIDDTTAPDLAWIRVSEPATLALLAFCMAALAFTRRRTA